MNKPLPTDIYLLEEMNATQVKDKITEKTVAILVLGACENHGNHMPFGSDFIFPMKLIEIILDEISNNKNNLILLPAVPYGVRALITTIFR